MKPYLYPLSPRPIIVETSQLSGRLYVDGNVKHNAIRFSFRFNRLEEISAVRIMVKINGKGYSSYECIYLECDNPSVRSGIIHPAEWSVGEKIALCVEPLCSYEQPLSAYWLDKK